MAKFILRRVVRGLVALILFQSLLFALIHALPHDFSSFIIAGPGWRAFIRQQFGLDQPLWEQYLRWLMGFVRLDLGVSYQHWPATVSQILLGRMSRTLLLFLSAAILAYLLGIWLGKMLAWRRGGLFEAGATLGSVAAYTSFAPWLGFVAINVFGWYLGWFPYQRLVDHNVWFRAPVTVDWLLGRMVATIGLALAILLPLWQITRSAESQRRGIIRLPFRIPRFAHAKERWLWRAAGLLIVGGGAWTWWSRSGLGYLALDVLAHLALPLGTVVLLSFGETMMIMRAAMLETLDEDYVLIARAKGLPDKVIRDRHVARNALLPVITRLMLNLPFVLVGSLVIERVFMWQAMGRIIFDAVEYLDIPVLLGILSAVGVVVLTLHVVLDILYVYLDPRLRYAGES